MKSLLFILLLPISVYGQIGIGHSVPLWGKTIETAEISYQVDRYSVHYFWNYSTDMTYLTGTLWAKNKRTSSLAFAVRAIQTKYVNLGGIASSNHFPTYDATRLNFLVEINIPIRQFVLSYTHISNGFGFFHDNNLGFDSFKIYIKL